MKEILAILSGLEAQTAQGVDRYLHIIDEALNRKRPFDRALFKDASGPVTAEQLYVNQKISDLISNAEMEQNDYRRGGKPNVFFGASNATSAYRSAFSPSTPQCCSARPSRCWQCCTGSCGANFRCEGAVRRIAVIPSAVRDLPNGRRTSGQASVRFCDRAMIVREKNAAGLLRGPSLRSG